jgi:hypothetical protein
LAGDYIHGFKLGHFNVVFSSYYVTVHDSLDGTIKQLPVEPYYFSEPIAGNGRVFFHNSESYVYETDGTVAGTKKISSLTAGEFNYDPYFFAGNNYLLYSVNHANNTELWRIDLNTDTDSLFSVLKPASSPIISPYAFTIGDHLIYARYTSAAGSEYWVYDGLPTGIKEVQSYHPILMSPNPAENKLTLTFEQGAMVHGEVFIFNTAGQSVSKASVYSDHLDLDITGFNPGQYFIRLISGNEIQYSGSFVKK